MKYPTKVFMPIWSPFECGMADRMIAELPDEEERAVALAAQYYFQGKYREAVSESQTYLDSLCPEIRSAALLLHSMANVGLGNTEETKADLFALQQAMKRPEDEHMAAIYEALRFLFSVFFHQDEVPEFVQKKNMALLSEGTRLYVMYGVSHTMYLRKNYREALGAAKAALMIAADRFPPVCVYLNVAASMAASSLHDMEQADDFFHQAWQIAEKEDYIQPFVEHHGMLQGQIEKYFRNKNPKRYNEIAEKVLAFSRGWMKIHNPNSVNKVTDRLSPYEFALAMMAVKGKSNQEIADYMHISINTVKYHISGIYQKVGVSSRKELEQYLNR